MADKSVRLLITFPANYIDCVDQLAEYWHISRSAVLNIALSEFVHSNRLCKFLGDYDDPHCASLKEH